MYSSHRSRLSSTHSSFARSDYRQKRLLNSRPSPSGFSGLRRISLVIALLVVVSLGYSLWSQHVAAQAAAQRQTQIQAALVSKQKAASLSQQMTALLAANPELTFSVAIGTAQGFQHFGSTAAFNGASTGKLLTAVAFLHQVETGHSKLHQQLGGMDAEQSLRQMIVDSDDMAWQSFNDYLTHGGLARYAHSIGFNDYDPDTDSFTTADLAMLLNKLHDRQLLNSADRSLLLGYMGTANYRDFIVAAVPKNDKVYHKIGLVDDQVNDAAIITHGSKSLALVIFTNGNQSYNWDKRAQLFQAITKAAITAYL